MCQQDYLKMSLYSQLMQLEQQVEEVLIEGADLMYKTMKQLENKVA